MLKKSPSKNIIAGPSKSKKTNKEKKQENVGEECMETSPPMIERDSPDDAMKMEYVEYCEEEPTVSEKSYVIFGGETVSCVAEQCLDMPLKDNVASRLAEDLSYRLREIISLSRLNMHKGKRKYIKTDDVNAAFKRLNIEPVYGPAEPNWVTFDDPNNLSCIPDEVVDLYEIAQEDARFVEPGDTGLDYKWITEESSSVNDALKIYCQKIMKSCISNKESLRMLVLKDMHKSNSIGPIIPHLCNFCFLILQKNITYNFLAIPVLELLEALTFNPCMYYSIDEKQMTLLIYLLLENIMNATNKMLGDIYPLCRTIGRLCHCWKKGAHVVVEKLKKHLPPDPMQGLTAPIICALSFIGNYALDAVVWPHLDTIITYLNGLEYKESLELRSAILAAIVVFCNQPDVDVDVLNKLRLEFGDGLLPIFNIFRDSEDDKRSSGTESDWFHIKKMLLKSRRVHSQQQVDTRESQYNLLFGKASPFVRKKNIIISGFKTLPIKRKDAPEEVPQAAPQEALQLANVCGQANVISGRRTLLTFKTKHTTQYCRSDYLLYGI